MRFLTAIYAYWNSHVLYASNGNGFCSQDEEEEIKLEINVLKRVSEL